MLTPVSGTLYRYGGDLPDPLTLYVGDTLAVGSATPAAETPDDVRVTFPSATPVAARFF